MVKSFSDWLCNLIVWGAIVTLAVLVYETFLARGFLANQANAIGALVAAGVIAVLSVVWPKY
jgi:hypothetical protein